MEEYKIKLSERQRTLIKRLRKYGNIWVGILNRRVINVLIENGLAKINKEGDLQLTKLGKTIEL